MWSLARSARARIAQIKDEINVVIFHTVDKIVQKPNALRDKSQNVRYVRTAALLGLCFRVDRGYAHIHTYVQLHIFEYECVCTFKLPNRLCAIYAESAAIEGRCCHNSDS